MHIGVFHIIIKKVNLLEHIVVFTLNLTVCNNTSANINLQHANAAILHFVRCLLESSW